MKQTKTLIIANTLAFAVVVLVNYLANALPLNGVNTGELSDFYPNLFVPAGLTFAIWGVIYTMLLLWIGNQVLALFRADRLARISAHIERVGWWFVISCVCNAAWIFAWHWTLLPVSILIMLGILYSLVQINLRTQNGVNATGAYEKALGHTTFGIYQGWITVATIANFTALLVTLGWNGAPLSPIMWTVVMIGIGGALAVYMVSQRNILFHGSAVAWAFLGIYIKRTAAADADPVRFAALAFMFLILFLMVVRLKRWLAY